MKKFLSIAAFLLVATLSYGQTRVTPEDASKHIGESVVLCGKIYGGKFMENSKTQPTLLNMGAAFPNHLVTIMVSKEVRTGFQAKPEEYLNGKNVCVTGKLIDSKGKPEIIIAKAEDIQLEE
ncbi:MAG: hypothetical protein ACO1OQ_15405 [Rufibacter sp.]